jgi:RNase H-fold protein (predicted Holliday junction resolvase)
MSGRNYLGIDWGATDVGLAFADGETRLAFALATLRNDARLLEKIAGVVGEKEVGTVVIGIASHTNRPQRLYPGEALGETLRSLLPGVHIVYQDEMFTTKMAQANLIERGVKGVSRHDDEEAARIILQEWLDRAK